MSTTQMEHKSFTELMKLKSYTERLAYLKVHGHNPGNQNRELMSKLLYKNRVWTDEIRPKIIERDLGCDIGIPFLEIEGSMIVHHINPVSEDDVINWRPCVFDPENLITVSYDTHNKIHYSKQIEEEYSERKPGDTLLWNPI